MSKVPEISIIIRTYNEEKYLPLLLNALDEQVNRDFESILVDSGSIDNTCAIANGRVDQLVQIEHHDFTFGYALNVGAKVARGKYLVMVSAHTKPCSSDWIEKLVAPLRSNKVAMSYGKQVGWYTSKFGEAVDFYRIFHNRREKLMPPHFFANNANSAVRKDLWEEHPFDEQLPGLEDAEFAKYWMAKGYDVIYEPEAPLHHMHEETWTQVHRRYFREAVAARVMGIHGPKHVLQTWLREGFWLLDDLWRMMVNRPEEVRPQPTMLCFKEILKFRYLKALGTAQGLLSNETIEDEESRNTYFFDRAAKAVVIEGPKRAILQDMQVHEPKPGEVVLRVAYVGVCATDLEIYDGELGYYKNGMAEFPIVPGHEFSATVSAVGQNVKHLNVGDPVVVECIQSCGKCDPCKAGNEIGCDQRKELGVMGRNGGYADYVTVPGHFVHKLPVEADLRMAALCEPIAVGLKGLRRLNRVLGAERQSVKCVVVGAGSLGHIVAKLLKLQGHEVHVLDRNEKKLAYFEGTGISYGDDDACLKGCEVVVEVTGNAEVLETIFQKTPSNVIILLLGLPYARHPFSVENIVTFEKYIVGSVGSRAEDFEEATKLVNKLGLEAYVENILPLDHFEQGWQRARAGNDLKIILEVAARQSASSAE